MTANINQESNTNEFGIRYINPNKQCTIEINSCSTPFMGNTYVIPARQVTVINQSASEIIASVGVHLSTASIKFYLSLTVNGEESNKDLPDVHGSTFKVLLLEEDKFNWLTPYLKNKMLGLYYKFYSPSVKIVQLHPVEVRIDRYNKN